MNREDVFVGILDLLVSNKLPDDEAKKLAELITSWVMQYYAGL